MSKLIYYIGAGASYGQKDSREILNENTENERLIVHEGLPIVNEITKCLLAFRYAIANAPIESHLNYLFREGYHVKGEDIVQFRYDLEKDIEDLCRGAKEHATIDTYAKKLYLTVNHDKLERLKNVLSTFFVWMQLEGKLDNRYDTFLANILQKDLLFPKNISVISWNYDSQFEIAYKSYNTRTNLPVYEKTVDSDFPELKDCGRIFKINGSANFGDFCLVNFINEDKNVPLTIQLIRYYGLLIQPNIMQRIPYHSHLSFAWESSEKQKQLFDVISKTTIDTESVVVIGYSFPYFNREVDRLIFSQMPNLKKIYIQDPNPDSVEPSLRAVLQDRNVKIEHRKDCTQFYLPREL